MAQLVAHLTVSRCVVGSSPHGAEHFVFSPSAPSTIKGLGMSSCVYATWHIKDSDYRKEKGII